jgi:hypothetical protein
MKFFQSPMSSRAGLSGPARKLKKRLLADGPVGMTFVRVAKYSESHAKNDVFPQGVFVKMYYFAIEI